MKRSMEALGLALATLMLFTPAMARANAFADSIPGYRSPGKAVLISAIATAVPIGIGIAMAGEHDAYGNNTNDETAALMITSGYLIGPSLGHFYAGRPGRAFVGVGMRSLAVVIMGAAIAASWNSESTGGDVLGVTGVATGAFFTVYDIAQAGHSANVTNEKLAARASIAPAAISNAPGVMVSVAF